MCSIFQRSEDTEAHVAEFTIDATTQAASLISDSILDYCEEVGGITVSSDCEVRMCARAIVRLVLARLARAEQSTQLVRVDTGVPLP